MARVNRCGVLDERLVACGGTWARIRVGLPALATAMAIALATVLGSAAATFAQTSGGAGGVGSGGFAGGAGGTGFTGAAGSDGTAGFGGPRLDGGGGGGGGAGGGNGGQGGTNGFFGSPGGSFGPGGTSGTPNGQNGGADPSSGYGGGGGGGGGFNGNGAGSATITNASPLGGGAGGNGGQGGIPTGQGGGGGGGGAGGYGAVVTSSGASSNTSSIAGGNGGNGGPGGNGVAGAGGNGGDGGVGVQFTASGVSFSNSGAVSGGNGGTQGAGGSAANGAGGAGIVGSGLTIINSDSITGGLSGDTVPIQANAIIFTGGANSIGNTGTISGGISVQGGSFAPALSTSAIGTPLSFSGPLTFAPGTQYIVRVSPSASDNATASGAATLTGATVNAQFATGSYVSKQYTILTATGGLGGTTFAGLTNTGLPAGASDSLSYSANDDDVYLNLTCIFCYTGLNGNQQAVANALINYFNRTGGIRAAFFGLTPGGLTLIDGEAATGAERAAFQLTNEFIGLMTDWFAFGGTGGVGQASRFAPDEQAEFPPDIALAYASVLKAPPAQTFAQRWTAWGSAYGGSNTASGDPAVGSNNITARTFGFAGGMDYHYSPDTIFGFALGGGGTNWGLAQGLGDGRSDAFQSGVYAITRSGPAYLSAALAFTNHWMTTDRTALGDQLTANFDAQSYGARVEAGYRYAVLPTLGVTPYAALQAQDFHTPSYSETDVSGGGFGLSYNAMNATDYRSELGARFDDPTLVAGLPLILRARLAWAHDWVSNPALDAVFESLPGASFVVNGAPMPASSALASAGAELFLASNWTFLVKFDGEFASGSQTYAGTGTLRYTW